MINDSGVKVSVRDLVEFLYREGHLVSSFKGSSRNVDAIKMHQKIQNQGGDEYNKEVYLAYTTNIDNVEIEVSGRADGIIIENDEVTVDEIKTTTAPLEEIEEEFKPVHWAQAKCYAFIYSQQKELKNIKVQLTYYSFTTENIKKFVKVFSFQEIKEFFYDVLKEYLKYARMLKDWTSIRNNSIRSFQFPFKKYRNGQRNFAVAVYKTIKLGKKLFAEAPTGTGKTMATLFPSIKAIGEGLCTKIFYLTAKNIGKVAAENTVKYMVESGLKIKVISLTSKEKICFKDKNCDPELCPFANGHYDRVNEAMEDIFKNENIITEKIIVEYAKKYSVCPFEFSLDLCNWADCIICDYNYVFDPRVYLRRFFDSYNDYVILVDEAHNLVDRSREMYSAELSKKSMLSLKKLVKESIPNLYKNINKINSFFLKHKKLIEEETIINYDLPEDIYALTRQFLNICDKWLSEENECEFKDEILDSYFNMLRISRTCEWYNEKYVNYFIKNKDDMVLKLFCLDPSEFIDAIGGKVRSIIFFSATLNPMDYYIDVLCTSEEIFKLRLKSPFPKENMCLIVDNKVSTKYSHRKYTYDDVIKDICTVINMRKGNYMVFLPSYEYMEIIYQKFIELDLKIHCVKQEYTMSEQEKEDFLNRFYEEDLSTLVGFVVMGGMFGEGIDLTGDKLIGAIIVGVGMPQISLERNLIRDYYDKKNGKGFQYSYTYPGMNKVTQAAGRVIRTEKDRGVVLLIDTRFGTYEYRNLFPLNWRPIFKSKEKYMENTLRDFWNL